ncbi:MAG: hypothetical protein NT091_02740 [Candidatus Falkowbacteria bacterium]|nr:hypothetical protein [Candidatus Falkowbacteria bacterium]
MVEQPKKTEEGIDDLINRIGKANNHKAIKDIAYDFIDSIDLNDKEKGLLRMTYSDITLTVNELSGAAGFERKPVDQKKSLLSLKEDPELRRHKDQAIAMLKRRFNNQPEKLSTEKTKSSEIETPPITTTSSEQPVIIESKSEAIAEALKSIKEEKEKALEEKITAKLDKFGLTDELDGLKEYQVLSNSQKILALEQLEQLLLEEGEANAEEFVDQGNFLTKHFRSLITNFRGKAHQDVFEKYKEKNNQTGLIKDLTEITKLITNGPDVTRHSNGRYEFIYAGDKLLEGANPSIAKRVAFDLAARNFNKAASDFFNALSNKIEKNIKNIKVN